MSPLERQHRANLDAQSDSLYPPDRAVDTADQMNIRKIAGYKSVQVGYVGRKNGDSNVSEG